MYWHPLEGWLWQTVAPFLTPAVVMVSFILLLLLFRPTRWYTVAGILAFIMI